MVARTFPGELGSLLGIRALVDAEAAGAGLEPEASYRLKLAVDEIATNIITHGYDEAKMSGSVDVSAGVNGGTLTVVLEDTAAPFDPSAHSMPSEAVLRAPLEDRPIGGLGIMLAAKSVDRLLFERVGDKNRTTLMVNLPPVHSGNGSP